MRIKNKVALCLLGGVLLGLLATSIAFAQEKDVEGSKDHPLISRYPGSTISYYDMKKFGEYVLPLGKLNKDGKLTKSQKLEIRREGNTDYIFRSRGQVNTRDIS